MTKLKEILPLLAKLSQIDGKRLTLAELAEEDGRSANHLQRVFLDQVGESPLKFSRRVNLQRAAATLLATERTVLDIALDSGFESHAGFTRAFRAMFDESPTAFRDRREAVDLALHAYQERVERTAPCIGLFRVSLKKDTELLNNLGGMMTYEIQKKTLEETPFLYIRRQCKQEEIAAALAEMLPAVFQYAIANGIAFAGPPTTRYPCFGPGLITIDAGLPIVELPVAAPKNDGTDEITVGTLAGGEVASTIHKGPYEGLGDAHGAIQTWATANDATTGAPWEVYLTDPGEVPDPKDWLTEVIHPLG